MCVNYAIWWAKVHVHVLDFLIDQSVVNAKGGIRWKIMGLNVPTIVV
jgi:hypothetical protein